MKKDLLKLGCMATAVSAVLCMGQPSCAAEVQPKTEQIEWQTNQEEAIHEPTAEDVYIADFADPSIDGGYIDYAVVLDHVVYQYSPRKESYTVVAFDDFHKELKNGEVIKLRSEILGKPVTRVWLEEALGPIAKIHLIIPETVKEIGIDEGAGNFASITFPKTLDFSESVFVESCHVGEINIKSANPEIKGVFYDLDGLKKIQFPDTAVSIGSESVSGMYNRCEIVIPDGVTSIGKLAFSDCGNLSVYIPASVKKIGKGAFTKGAKGSSYHQVHMIYCEKDSVAQKYAEKNGISYTLVEKSKSARRVSKIKVSKKKITLKVGEMRKISYTVQPFYATKRNLKFKSSNSKTVSVDQDGFITAKQKGKAKIILRAKDKGKKKVIVNVTVK